MFNSSSKPHKSKENKFLPKDYFPKRFGLRFDPPTIILEYMLQNSGKLYHHKMKLNRQKENMNDSEQLDYLNKRHCIYLTHESITDDQILALIQKLKRDKNSKNSDPKPSFISSNSKNNSSSTKENNLLPLKNGGLTKLEPLAPLNLKKEPEKKNSKKSDDFWDNFIDTNNDQILVDEFEDYNKLDKEQLDKKKKQMDVVFVKNQKKPGDRDFLYDTQEDFHPNKNNEWDMDDDMDIV